VSGGGPVPAVCLVVLDGWGLAEPGPGNAVAQADTPVFDALWASEPHTTLTAMGESVGLPEGQMGNSEVGHLNLGAGAIVPQDLARIDAVVADGTLASNEVLAQALRGAGRVHLLGLVSDGGVHASDRHLRALIELCAEWGLDDVVVHAFTDGRDTAPTATSSCTPSPTAATPRRPAACATSRRCRAGATRSARGGSGRWSGATSRWTATSAGTAPRRPTTCSSTAAPSTA